MLETDQPLQSQIYRYLVDEIRVGRIRAGSRLPSSRQLSEQLSVSRNTVVAVIEQLKAEGFLTTHVGRGSFVNAHLPMHSLTAAKAPASHRSLPPLSKYATQFQTTADTHPEQTLPFTPGVPDVSAFPFAVWNRLKRVHQDRKTLLAYNGIQGYLPLRKALAHYLATSRGVHCHSEQILITQGAQQAISLCTQLLVDKDDVILLENPGYQGASAMMRTQKPKILAVPLADSCLNVDWLKQQANSRNAKLLYTTPTHQYPMGGLLPASQRLALLDWANDNQVWIIEDDYDSEFHFQHKPIAAMQGMTESNNVIYLGSFSKTLFPSLRLGYLVLPEPLIGIFNQAKKLFTGESPLIDQAITADFIREGHFIRHLRKMRHRYKEKWLDIEEKIRHVLGKKATIIAESAGMHIALEIPDVDDIALKQALADHGFGSSALSSYYIAPPAKTGLVLGFAHSTEQDRTRLVQLLDVLI